MIKYIPLLSLTVVLLLAGCRKDPTPEPPPVDPSPKTLLFYGNIGEPYYTRNIDAAGAAVAEGALIEGQRIIVFHEQRAGSVVYEVVRDRKSAGGFRRDTLRRYGKGEISPMDPVDMRSVISEMRDMAPAEHYGLAFGSHGRGWIPKTESSPLLRAAADSPFKELWEKKVNPMTRYLGAGDDKIDIREFADAIGDMEWDFILLDACLMASVEAVYEMRGMADRLIVSPAEIIIDGFPYKPIVKSLFGKWSDLESVARIYVEHYRDAGSCATISLVDTSQLDALAKAVRDIRERGYNEVTAEDAENIQGFEGLIPHVFYDLDVYMRYWTANGNAVLYGNFLDQLRRTVPYSDHTEYYYTNLGVYGAFPILHCCGLTAYIPTEGTSSLLDGYKNTSWYKAVYE